MTIKKQDTPTQDDILQAKITLETAQIAWRDLQRFFAAGTAIAVDPSLDLVEVATEMSRDNKAQFEGWYTRKLVGPVSDAQAEHWYQGDETVWAVVVAPWVLVQAPEPEPR